MKNLIEVVQDAGRNCVAIGHFNIADLVLLKGIFGAARELNVPVIVGASEGEREFAGTQQLAALVRSLREEFDYPIFLNADHTHSLAGGLEAVKAGFDSVVFDLSTLPLEENAQSTKEAVEAFKSMNPSVVVEGEIGDIGSGPEIHADGPGPERALTTPAEARQFVTETKVARRRQFARHAQEYGYRQGAKASGDRTNSRDQIRDLYTSYATWRFRHSR